jgi:sulfur relay (sulfurtransferase) DsrF/TusC family protein
MTDEGDAREALDAVARYGHLIDDRDWTGLSSVFTDDAIIEWVNEQGSTTVAYPELVALWAAYDHPSAHHSTNAIVVAAADETVEVRSKGLAVEADGRTWSVTYADVLVRTERGWRINRRTVRERPSTARTTRTATADVRGDL